ncbi:MAG: hypothetical protein QOF44_4152 [Streptomyces sp.]|jgi:hypothetical protein|nr:hypothetical protein [Streptomyces sp.]
MASAALAVGAVAGAVVGAVPSSGSPHAPPAPLAGDRAAVGREHPGRPQQGALRVPVEPDAAVPVLATPDTGNAPDSGSGSESESGSDPTRAESGSEVALEVLPLGVGLTLMGAGLGFVGLRLRRGR